ncbi:MAG: hypothetical protein DWQ36_03545 [Acidobacteria bacterium]|nr:MAG: hypothetical protein DWQ30_12985 [Acidobacteriota bacterium]REK10670.1 MAG: hypothetical protein DWQ36_03545 [Acidobacteriota bacterium]
MRTLAPKTAASRRRSHAAAAMLCLGVLFPAGARTQTAAEIGGCAATVPSTILDANPTNYQAALAQLGPGVLVRLAPGTYDDGFSLTGVHGLENDCAIVEGPESGAPAIVEARQPICCNTIELRDSSYLVLRHLTVDSLGLSGVDGVKAQDADPVHHVTLEHLTLFGQGGGQQTVGISTKTEAWNWVIAHNRITGAGTGIYLGNSDGDDEFVRSLIEFNVVLDPIGYAMQIKHQNARDAGMPSFGTTIVRHNVFSKQNGASTGGDARPNLLLGAWPPGSSDRYLVYGNFFFENPTPEALLQANGNVSLYDNLFVTSNGSAVALQPHTGGPPQEMLVLHNTVLAVDEGIRLTSPAAGFEQRIVGNAVFAAQPIVQPGGAVVERDNLVAARADAPLHVQNPFGVLAGPTNRLDLHPLTGELQIVAYDLGLAGPVEAALSDLDRDFNGLPRPTSAATFVGAYATDGANPGWLPELDEKVLVGAPLFADGFESGDASAWSATTQ